MTNNPYSLHDPVVLKEELKSLIVNGKMQRKISVSLLHVVLSEENYAAAEILCPFIDLSSISKNDFQDIERRFLYALNENKLEAVKFYLKTKMLDRNIENNIRESFSGSIDNAECVLYIYTDKKIAVPMDVAKNYFYQMVLNKKFNLLNFYRQHSDGFEFFRELFKRWVGNGNDKLNDYLCSLPEDTYEEMLQAWQETNLSRKNIPDIISSLQTKQKLQKILPGPSTKISPKKM